MFLRPEATLTCLKRAADECKSLNGENSFTTNLLGVIIDSTRPLCRGEKDWIA